MAIRTASKLFQPLRVGTSDLKHRIVMAPLTRFRASDEHVPLPMVKEYYSQRASVPGTLLITEATIISTEAGGYPNVPGISDEAQVAAWKEVTDAVHKKGSYIYLQLWALGRVANADFLGAKGLSVVSSGDVQLEGHTKPRSLTVDEIKQYMEAYRHATKSAIKAGFDGVEIHGANGYLVDQFIEDVTNNRTDQYGGSIENRTRFVREAVAAVAEAAGDPKKVGIRLSPFSLFQGMKMEDPMPQFLNVVKAMRELNIGYVHLVESRANGSLPVDAQDKPTELVDPLVKEFLGDGSSDRTVLIAGGYDGEVAQSDVDEKFPGLNVGIVFGRQFIANPDLPYRIKNGLELNPYDRNTFYTPKSEVGYLDYPFSKEFLSTAEAAA